MLWDIGDALVIEAEGESGTHGWLPAARAARTMVEGDLAIFMHLDAYLLSIAIPVQ
jgi:hypothetical protein